ncbi:MAG TPA: hypothetical protein VMT96_00785 [Candidatus Bathyarchaeia archaeon]|nr:hypothetical protein [Candidatus Bathyarchaeia archaeon]
MEKVIRRFGGIAGTLHAEVRQILNRYFPSTDFYFEGDANKICEQIVDQLFEGDFFRTSLGHFNFFWMRDFGTVCDSLVKLGYKEKAHHTLSWALFHYQRAGDVTLCIDKAGNTFNAPAKKSVDALPWLIHCLVVSDYKLNKMEHRFLERMLRRYCKTFLDAEHGDLKSMKYAEMRDAVYYDRSAYSLALVGRMAHCVKILGLKGFAYPVEHYQQVLHDQYWNGEFFKADYATNIWSSECALMPFFLNVIDDKEKAEKTFDYINKARLNALYPLQYCQEPYVFKYRFGMGRLFMNNYTGTTIWTWHGTFYLHILKKYGRDEYDEQYANFGAMIERHGTYPELLNADGSWYKTPIYRSDPGMVWAALFLELETKK